MGVEGGFGGASQLTLIKLWVHGYEPIPTTTFCLISMGYYLELRIVITSY